MRRPFAVLLAAIIVAAMSVAAMSVAAEAEADGRTLVIRDGERIVQRLGAATGDRFTIAWIHSVEEEAWEETFEIRADGAIHLVSTRFKTFGAGTPNDIGTRTRIEDGWVVMDGIDRPVDPYAVQAAAAEDYKMRWKGRTIPLAQPGTPRILTFAVERREDLSGNAVPPAGTETGGKNKTN